MRIKSTYRITIIYKKLLCKHDITYLTNSIEDTITAFKLEHPKVKILRVEVYNQFTGNLCTYS